MKRATQNDVARLAGVSRATVSYVLNGRTDGTIRVSDETREKILVSMRELDYRVNLNARSLKTNRTQLLAVLVPDLSNPFYPILIRGAQICAHAHGYRILIVDSFSREEDERDFLAMSQDHLADGLILASSYLEGADIHELLETGIPSVGVGPRLFGTGIDTISIDQEMAVRTLLRHLQDKGHRKIAHLTGDLNNVNGRIRLESYRKVMAEFGYPADGDSILEGNFLREHTAGKVEKWFSAFTPSRRPTALFSANDLMAIEAIKALSRIGIRVPEDVAVCGFDNIPEAEYVDPPLTTVGHNVEQMGHTAAKLVIERIEGTRTGDFQQVEMPFALWVRKST
jgi:LacI family transcriptional regulator